MDALVGRSWPDSLDSGLAAAAHAGEARSGDVGVLVPTAQGALTCVIDGLGHGDEAADAGEAAAAVVRANAEAGPQELFELCHAALADTRGAVMTAAWFDLERSELSWTGVGNVDARLVRAGPEGRQELALVFGGVLGYSVPKLRLATMALGRGDLLVMLTDGIEGAISAALAGGGAAQALAERILAMCAKGTDDALALVVRYR